MNLRQAGSELSLLLLLVPWPLGSRGSPMGWGTLTWQQLEESLPLSSKELISGL